MKNSIYALVFMAICFAVPAFAEANDAKCVERAVKVILNKGKSRGEQASFQSIELFNSNAEHEGYYVFLKVIPRNSSSFEQVCQIIMKSSNCSYDKTFACAKNLKDLED